MSTRFVWNKSTIKLDLSVGGYLANYVWSGIDGAIVSSSAVLCVDLYDELTVDQETGTLSGVKTDTQRTTVELSFGGNQYYYLNPSSGNYFSPYVQVDGNTYYIDIANTGAQNPSNRRYYLRDKDSNESGLQARIYYSSIHQSNYFSSAVGNCNYVQSGQVADEYVGTVSNASSSTYPP